MIVGRKAGNSSPSNFQRSAIALTLFTTLFLAAPAQAAWIGMVSDNGGKAVGVFDATTDTLSKRIDATPGMAQGDCAISADQSTGITTNSSRLLTFVDLAQTSAPPAEPLEISNLGVDMAMSPDGRFLVSAGGGALGQPLSVVNLEDRQEVGTADLFEDHSSVAFCDDGTLLVTTTHGDYYGSPNGAGLFDASLDADGQVALLGHSVSAEAVPNNSVCAPGSRAGVVLDREGGITSFTLPELEVAEVHKISTREVISASFSANGQRLFVRTVDSVEAFDFDPETGHMTRDWQRPAPMSTPFFGMDQIAAHPTGEKVYVDGGDVLLVLDANNGSATGFIETGDATGVCFAATAPLRLDGDLPQVVNVPIGSGIPVAPPP